MCLEGLSTTAENAVDGFGRDGRFWCGSVFDGEKFSQLPQVMDGWVMAALRGGSDSKERKLCLQLVVE